MESILSHLNDRDTRAAAATVAIVQFLARRLDSDQVMQCLDLTGTSSELIASLTESTVEISDASVAKVQSMNPSLSGEFISSAKSSASSILRVGTIASQSLQAAKAIFESYVSQKGACR